MTKAIIIVGAGTTGFARHIVESLIDMADVQVVEIESGIEDGTFEISENPNLRLHRETIDAVRAVMKEHGDAILAIDLAQAKVLIDICTSHIEDVVTGLLTRTYELDANESLPEKLETLDLARAAYFTAIGAQQERERQRLLIADAIRGAREAFGVLLSTVKSDAAKSLAGDWIDRLGALLDSEGMFVTADENPMRFDGLFSDAFNPLLHFDESLAVRKAAVKAIVRPQYRDTGNGQADYERLRDLIGVAAAKIEDGAVLGLNSDGKVLQWNADDRAAYTAGETVEEFGFHNLREHELELVNVSRDVWRAAVNGVSSNAEAKEAAAA